MALGQVCMPKHIVEQMELFFYVQDISESNAVFCLKSVHPSKLQAWFLVIMQFVHDAAFTFFILYKLHID